MTEFKTREFGKIIVLSPGEKCPKGICLCETHEGVVVEEYFDNSKVYPLYVFEERYSFSNKSDFKECLAEARKYEPDLELAIYIVATTTSVSMPEEENLRAQKEECFACRPKWNERRPWSLSPPHEKCEKCLKGKFTKK